MEQDIQIYKPLDIVSTKSGAIAIVTECYIDSQGNQHLSLSYLDYFKNHEKCAWWSNEIFANTKDILDDLTLLDSIPRLLANTVSHNMGTNKNQGNINFPLKR